MSENIKFEVEHCEYFVIINIICSIIKPNILKTITPPNAVIDGFSNKGVVLRGGKNGFPMWLCGFLVHFYHTTRFVAIFDPRIPGAVVVADHYGVYTVGEIIEI